MWFWFFIYSMLFVGEIQLIWCQSSKIWILKPNKFIDYIFTGIQYREKNKIYQWRQLDGPQKGLCKKIFKICWIWEKEMKFWVTCILMLVWIQISVLVSVHVRDFFKDLNHVVFNGEAWLVGAVSFCNPSFKKLLSWAVIEKSSLV